MVYCLEQGADLHMAQLMPLPLTIQTGFTFLVLAHPGSPRQTAVKRVCVSNKAVQTVLDVNNTVRKKGHAKVEFSKSTVCDKFHGKIPLFLELPEFPFNTMWGR